MSATIFTALLRAPERIAEDCLHDRELPAIVRTSLAAIVLGAALFGGTLGTFRGREQILFAALKVPLALLATLAISAPAFHALAASLGRPLPFRSVLSLCLAATARSSLVLLALTPALWLSIEWGTGYHASAVLASMAYGLAGFAALGLLLRGLGDAPFRGLTTAAFVAVFFAVGGQTSWILRPYLVRPRTEDVPFLRAREGSFADALYASTRSSFEIYDPELAPAFSREATEWAPEPRQPSDVTPSLEPCHEDCAPERREQP